MANTIKPKRSNTASKVPNTSELVSGELGVNMADRKVYINNGTAVVQVGAGLLSALGDVTLTSPTNGQSLSYNGTAWVNSSAGAGNVTGAASSTDNAITRFDGTTGKVIQNSTVTIDDNGNFANVNAFTFDTTPTTPTPTATGSMFWDNGNQTPSVILNANTELQLGQENVALVYNGTGSTIAKGSVVAVSGAQGQRPSVVLADADSEALSAPTLGVTAEAIANGAEGFVCTFGLVRGINTSAFTAGAPIYLSQTAGAFTQTRPSAPAHTVALGWVISVNASSGEVFININNGWELDELHNVLITSPANGNTLIYDAVAGVWENANITAGTGISVTNGAGTITIAATNAGTVTSVTGTSPVASTGGATPAISLSAGYGDTQNPYASKTANFVLAAPNGTAGVPTFRAIVAADIPTLNQNTTGNAATATTAVSATTPTFTGDSVDKDNITTRTDSGFYQSSTATTAEGWPVNDGGWQHMIACTHGNDANYFSMQIGGSFFDNLFYGRKTNGSGTTAWVNFITSGNIGSQIVASCTGTSANVTGTVAIANGGTGATTNTAARTNLGATTVGSNFFTLTNPSAITFPRMNADNTVSSLDAATFRTAIGAGTGSGTVTSVTGTAPVVSSGGATPAISMAAATTSVNGYLTSTDWNTFNGKQAALGFTPYNATNPSNYIALASAITGYTVGTNTALAATDTLLAGLGKIQGQINARGTGNGTVTSVAALTLGTTGTDLSSTVATGTTTPVITLQVPTASATNRGALSSADWTTFNGKYSVGGALGTPSSGTLTNCTFPTLNQNTTGYAADVGGGVANQILYQTGANATSYITAPTTASTYLQWNGSAFTWASAGGGNAFERYEFVATASQTTFAVGVTLSVIQVYVSGVLQKPTSDYTISGTNVILNAGVASGTIVSVQVFSTFNVADTYSVASANNTFLAKAGGTMSGAIAMASNKITGLGAPTVSGDAATKDYVDSSVGGVIPSQTGNSGKYLTTNGTATSWGNVATGAVTVKKTIISSGSGTFTTDPKTLYAEVIVTGGGGGGGGSDSDGTSCSASGGGGGGGTAIKWFTAAELGASAAYVIGAGGSAGAVAGGNGGDGTASTFDPIGTGLTLTGGFGGGGAGTGSAYPNTFSAFTGGNGGSGTNGDFNHTGLDGLNGLGFVTNTAAGGNGGASYWGGGAKAPILNNTAGAVAGANATIMGAGGSGAVNTNSTAGVVGGTGAGGEILVIEYLSA